MLMVGNLSNLVELLLSRPFLDEIICNLYTLKKKLNLRGNIKLCMKPCDQWQIETLCFFIIK